MHCGASVREAQKRLTEDRFYVWRRRRSPYVIEPRDIAGLQNPFKLTLLDMHLWFMRKADRYSSIVG
jgi:hypothetical protein